MKKKEKGITLIALVITVILLLILAGVTIRWITTGNSIFKYADIAKKETKRGEIIEYLDLTLVDEQTGGYKETVETIIKNTQKRVKANGKSDLSALAKEVETREVETKKYNEKDAEYYFYVVVDEEVYKVGANGAEYIGRKSSEEIEIQEGEIKFEYSKSELTNENVKVTIINKTNIEGATLLYKTTGEKDGSEGWKEYNGEIEIEKNCSIFAKVSGITGEIKTATGNVENIDKLEPKTFTSGESVTTNSITVTANTEDQEKTEDYATSGIAGYSFKIDEEDWTTYQKEGEYTFEKLTQGTEHTIKIKAKDNVGNEMSTPVEIKLSTNKMVAATTGTGGNISFEGLPSNWTNKDVTVTAKTTSGYKIQTSTDTKTWDPKAEQTLSANGKVYARLVDSTGQYAEGESWATAEVTKIDKDNPNVPTVTLNLANNNNSYTSGTWTNQNVKVTFEATDNGGSGVVSYEYSANAKDNISAKESGYLVNTDGTTNIYIRAVDGATNRSAWSELKIVKKDTVNPTVELTGTANGSTDVKLTGTGTDANCNIYYGWSANKDTQPTNWIAANAKTKKIENSVTTTQCFWVKDEAGNTVNKLATVSKHEHDDNTCYKKVDGYAQNGQIIDYTSSNEPVYELRCSACNAYLGWGTHGPFGYHCTQKVLICNKGNDFTVSIQ